jgi:hypothetical protein
MTAERALSRALLVLSAAVLAVIGAALLVGDPRVSVALLAGDDAGYYLAIARNACLGHGVSFDRVHPTNGFNPLLTVLLIAADRAFVPGLSLVGCYRAGLMVTFLALVVGLVFLVRLAGRWLEERTIPPDSRTLLIAASVTFYCLFLVPKKQFGMDAALVLAIGIAWLERWARNGPLAPGARAAAVDGVLLGLLVLARVDNLPLLTAAYGVLAVLAIAGTARDRGAAVQRALWTALTLAPFVAWGTRTFGTWLPVSARIKSSFPHPALAASLAVVRHSSVNAVDQLSFAVAYAAACGVLILTLRAAAAGSLLARLRDPRGAIRTVLALTLVQRFTFMLLFSRTDVQGGYVMLAHVFNLIVLWDAVGALAVRSGARAGRPVLAAALALTLVSVALFAGKAATLRSRLRHPEAGNEMSLAQRIAGATRPDDVLYGGAFGLVGYFSDRAWINGDGVANTEDYQRAIAGGDLNGWLRRSGVTHVVFASGDTAFARREGPVWLHVGGAISGRVDSIAVAPRDLVLEGWLARGLSAGHTGSRVYLVRWGS